MLRARAWVNHRRSSMPPVIHRALLQPETRCWGVGSATPPFIDPYSLILSCTCVRGVQGTTGTFERGVGGLRESWIGETTLYKCLFSQGAPLLGQVVLAAPVALPAICEPCTRTRINRVSNASRLQSIGQAVGRMSSPRGTAIISSEGGATHSVQPGALRAPPLVPRRTSRRYSGTDHTRV